MNSKNAFLATALWVGMLVIPRGFAADKPGPWNHPPRETIPGLRHRTFTSPSMRVTVGYNIWLPPQYDTSPARRFPVIYYLHGYDGHESSYLDYARLCARAVQDGAMSPAILVFVNGGATSFFSDSPDRTVLGETCVVRELIPHLDQTWRTMAAREGRALHGYSMGGFGALKFGFKHPDLFGSVVAYGATLADAEILEEKLGRVYKKMFGGQAIYDQSNPFILARQNADQIRGRLGVRVVLGNQDEFLELNRRLHKFLDELKITHDYEEVPGVGHQKESLYETAAANSFRFTGGRFPQAK